MIGICRIYEVDTLIASLIDDPFGHILVRFPAKHHGAKAQRRNFKGALAKVTIIHIRHSYSFIHLRVIHRRVKNRNGIELQFIVHANIF